MCREEVRGGVEPSRLLQATQRGTQRWLHRAQGLPMTGAGARLGMGRSHSLLDVTEL